MSSPSYFLSVFFQARLSRRLALWVFASIVLIEIILLVPSTFRREREVLAQIEQSTIQASQLAIQVLPRDASETEILDKLYTLHQRFSLGLSVYSATGDRLGQFGEAPALSWEQAQKTSKLRTGDRYDIAWETSPLDGRSYVLILRQDASDVSREVYGFILRVTGLVVIISVVVTGSTMVALGMTVIAPILQLRQGLVLAGKSVRQGTPAPVFAHQPDIRRDELAEVVGAFREMYLQVMAAIAERKTVEQELTQLNEQLEARVLERTQEVDEKNRSLLTTLRQLETTQGELVESEKMAALGHLVAGIAHEMNTPLGAIQASADNLAGGLEQLSKILAEVLLGRPLQPGESPIQPEHQAVFGELLHQIHTEPPSRSSREKRKLRRTLRKQLESEEIPQASEIAEFCVDLDIHGTYQRFLPVFTGEPAWMMPFLQTIHRLHGNSQTICTAVARTSKTVFALKHYAQINPRGEPRMLDIHQGLETVLELYHNHSRRGLTLTRHYGQLPAVWCYPDDLIQVWTHLLHNAVQATVGQGEIRVSTSVQGHAAVIAFEDSGPGIPPENQARIFEPFFTTKPQGEGNGLGLGICQQLIEKHQGVMDLVSQPGRTIFTVRIPLAISKAA